MADKFINQLDDLAVADQTDKFVIYDSSASETKRIDYANLFKNIQSTGFILVDSSDASKKATFDISGISTSTTRTYILPNANTTLVGIGTTQTLTNKTLTAPVIATIINSGTLTLPTSTDTLVGRATTDTLTNKTLTSPTINNPTLNVNTISEFTAANGVTIDGLNIKDGALTTSNSVVEGNITNSAVTTNKIADDAVTAAKINISSTDANGWTVMDFGDHKIAWKSGTITGGSRAAGATWAVGSTGNLPVGCSNVDAIKNLSYAFRMTGNAFALGINVESSGSATTVNWTAINNAAGTVDFGTPEYWCQVIF